MIPQMGMISPTGPIINEDIALSAEKEYSISMTEDKISDSYVVIL